MYVYPRFVCASFRTARYASRYLTNEILNEIRKDARIMIVHYAATYVREGSRG